ncbi:MAG: ABC transporter permease [Bifidobacterium sp.]
MGRHQRAESSGLLSFLICAIVGATSMMTYINSAPAIWQVRQRLFMACSGIVAVCGVVSFSVGYARQSRSWTFRHGWLIPVRRVFEILALSIVYGSTLFLSSFMLLGLMNDVLGTAILGYLPSICAGLAGIMGYVTLVQADFLDAKTIASLLPFFVVSGVSTAGMTSDDPYWYDNNFSELGDRTTFAARMFNSTLMLAGACIIIVSYFAISELITTYRMSALLRERRNGTPALPSKSDIAHFPARMTFLSAMLILSGVAFIGIGIFRYTPHPILHNVFARGLPCLMCVLLVGLPWLAPQLSKVMYLISDLSIVLCAIAGVAWLKGDNTLTNVEALAGLLFLGWFIVFSRQIAAIEADRVHAQLVLAQGLNADALGAATARVRPNLPGKVGANVLRSRDLESRLASDR